MYSIISFKDLVADDGDDAVGGLLLAEEGGAQTHVV